MNPKYLQTPTANRDRWMVSYMDVLTILLIFFVAIATRIPQHPAPKPNAAPAVAPGALDQPISETPVAQLISVHPGLTPPVVPDSRQTLLEAQKKLEQHGLDLRLEPRGLVISLPQAILFQSGEDSVNRQAMPIISRIASVLRDIPNQVILVGHADAVPIHNRHFHNNWDLSTARSLTILELLSHQYGISEARLSVASYGPYRPNGPNDTADGRARNRRVEIVISGESAQP
jgi:chemotaxis protein MotB